MVDLELELGNKRFLGHEAAWGEAHFFEIIDHLLSFIITRVVVVSLPNKPPLAIVACHEPSGDALRGALGRGVGGSGKSTKCYHWVPLYSHASLESRPPETRNGRSGFVEGARREPASERGASPARFDVALSHRIRRGSKPLAIVGSPVGARKDCVVARLGPADQGLKAPGDLPSPLRGRRTTARHQNRRVGLVWEPRHGPARERDARCGAWKGHQRHGAGIRATARESEWSQESADSIVPGTPKMDERTRRVGWQEMRNLLSKLKFGQKYKTKWHLTMWTDCAKRT